MKLKTQAERLAEMLPTLERKHGAENPFVKGLKEQLASLQRQQDRREQYQVGMQAPLR